MLKTVETVENLKAWSRLKGNGDMPTPISDESEVKSNVLYNEIRQRLQACNNSTVIHTGDKTGKGAGKRR